MNEAWRGRMLPARWRSWLAWLLVLGLGVAGCRPTQPLEDAAVIVAPTEMPAVEEVTVLPPTATVHATALPTDEPTEAPKVTSTPTRAPTSVPTNTPVPEPENLVVLHTNDNWGETEPCG